MIRFAGALFALMTTGALGAQDQPPRQTAANVVDNVQAWFVVEDNAGDAAAALRRWFALARFEKLPEPPPCADENPSCPEIDEVYRDPLAWTALGLPGNIVVLRDMHGWEYLAGCPAVELPAADLIERGLTGERPAAIDPLSVASLRQCLDIEAGRSFSLAGEGGSLRLVVRGGEAPLVLLATRRSEPATTSTPYQPEPSKTTGAFDTTQRISVAGGVFDTSPQWSPAPLGTRGSPSRVRLSGPEIAAAGEPTGRLRVHCEQRELGLSVDGAYMGECPLLMPISAGRHLLHWTSGSKLYEHMVRVDPSETVELSINAANECVQAGALE